jgi:hypothetical protein
MNEEPEYITINEMVKRDLNKKIESDTKPKQLVYQIQANKNNNTIFIVNVGEFSFIPTTKILEITDGKYFCKLLAMVIPHSDIDQDIKCMISFFVSRKKKPEKVLCRLSYSYITSEKKFCVCIEKDSHIEIIEKYNEFHGNEESIYLLTNIILRKDVKKKIFN